MTRSTTTFCHGEPGAVRTASMFIAAIVVATSVNTIAEFVAHYHGERNHQGIGNELIRPLDRAAGRGSVRRRQRVGGMLNYYYRAGVKDDRVIGHHACLSRRRRLCERKVALVALVHHLENEEILAGITSPVR